MTHFILGSQSPRRKEILNYFSLAFEQQSSDFDESTIPFTGDPKKYVATLAHCKSLELANKFPSSIILTADTVVYYNGKVYNKPKDEEEAFSALTELVGQWHSVFTALCIYDGRDLNNPTIYEEVEETRVLLNALTPDEIRHYHSKIHWNDKAAGYAIQTGAGLIVNKIDGCYHNVMGLPINTLRKLLKKSEIELWDFVK